jgi:iron-sulfur cluster repair protein YtfE (RIC family)
MTDPVSDFAHTHDRLSTLAMELRRSVQASRASGFIAWGILIEQLQALREELLAHFAKEEEGLFPFVRANIPSKVDAVNRMEGAHDMICGTVVRLAHLLSRPPLDPVAVLPSLHALHERFERAYADHSREETDLFSELGTSLDGAQRAILVELLLGL